MPRKKKRTAVKTVATPTPQSLQTAPTESSQSAPESPGVLLHTWDGSTPPRPVSPGWNKPLQPDEDANGRAESEDPTNSLESQENDLHVSVPVSCDERRTGLEQAATTPGGSALHKSATLSPWRPEVLKSQLRRGRKQLAKRLKIQLPKVYEAVDRRPRSVADTLLNAICRLPGWSRRQFFSKGCAGGSSTAGRERRLHCERADTRGTTPGRSEPSQPDGRAGSQFWYAPFIVWASRTAYASHTRMAA
eukprot:scaffold1206_cov388-Prasinococcus_capsulatus_cf.AAC.37